MQRLLIVDEDPFVRAELATALRDSGFTTIESADPWAALEALPAWRPDLIVLEWASSGTKGGSAALDYLKREPATRDIPVLLVSSSVTEEERILGLQSGGDDFVTKPYSRPEVVARIRALLRRRSGRSRVIEIGGLRLDATSHTVTAESGPVRLRPAEFRLLYFFMTNPNSVHTRAHLLHRVWYDREEMGERSVDVHIRRLRQALSEGGHDGFIQTVRGIGYRFSDH